MERRGKFFRSIKIFHKSPVFSPRRGASRYRLQRRVRDLSGDVVTRCAQNWTFVENFYRSKKFSTPFHVVTRCAQNWTIVENLAPKKSPTSSSYTPPHSYVTGSVKHEKSPSRVAVYLTRRRRSRRRRPKVRGVRRASEGESRPLISERVVAAPGAATRCRSALRFEPRAGASSFFTPSIRRPCARSDQHGVGAARHGAARRAPSGTRGSL